MKLLTKELEQKLPPLKTRVDDQTPVIVHFFNPIGRGHWFALSYDREEGLFFGYVSLFGDWNDELGYFSLNELESLRLPLGLRVERDKYWNTKTTLAEVKARYTKT